MALSDYQDDLGALAIYGLGIAAYALLVALLYVPMGTRMMFAKRLGNRAVSTVGRRFLYVLAFPFLSFAFFLIVSASMLFLGNFTGAQQLGPTELLTIAMGVVLSIRVCAYFNENVAADLAKVMPLSMLAVTLVTNELSDLRESIDKMRALAAFPDLLVLYFGIIVIAEFLLRGVYELLGRPRSAKSLAPAKPR